jgi:membrane peptidoglycan carboxypeptidase
VVPNVRSLGLSASQRSMISLPQTTYVPDNAEVRFLIRFVIHLSLGLSLLGTTCSEARASSAKAALASSLGGTQASAVVLDERSGALLATVGDARSSVPGSVIKPLLLAYALNHGIVRPEMSVYCQRKLKVGGRSLPCTHPADQVVLTARTALAESCNTWFAEMARQFSGRQLEAALDATHLQHLPMQDASVEQRQLAVLGLRGVTASPLLLAQAFRRLLQPLSSADPVAQGLRDSVRYGMANPAAVPGIDILGKTGTASSPGEAWTHGWFAGALAGRFVIVVYVPHGDGGTAALLAHKFFSAMAVERKTP